MEVEEEEGGGNHGSCRVQLETEAGHCSGAANSTTPASKQTPTPHPQAIMR